MANLVEAKDLSLIRQGRKILDNVSLNVSDDDYITIIGPNGSGKSTLLKCLMGFFGPDSGIIERKPEIRIGYLPQRLMVSPTLPIMARDFIRLRKKSTRAEFEEAAEDAGATESLRTPVHALSSGELQRVLLARALLGHPELLVLDEPGQSLDIKGQLAFQKLVTRIYAERKISVLMVSHDLHLVMASSSRVVCLYHHVCCEGQPVAVSRHPEFVRLFGADMASMLAFYRHDHDHTHENANGA